MSAQLGRCTGALVGASRDCDQPIANRGDPPHPGKLPELRTDADDPIQDVTQEIGVTFRHSPAAAKRNTMRILGFRFFIATNREDEPDVVTEHEPIEMQA